MNFNEDIKAYIDGELSPERTEEVRIALEQDPELMEEYTSMKDISNKLQSLIRQPQVKGVEQTKSAVMPARKFRWVEGLVTVGLLVIVSAVLFPVFSKAKMSSKAAAALSDRKQAELADAMEKEMAKSERGGDFSASTGVPEEGGGGAGTASSNAMRDGAVAGEGFEDGLALGAGAPVDSVRISQGFGGSALQATKDKPNRAGTTNIPATQMPTDMMKMNDADYETRFVIKDGSFTILVKDVREAMDKATQLARTNGGYIEASNIDEPSDKKGVTTGYLTIRLPQKNFEAAVEKVRSYGDIRSENTSGDDVTGQVTDMEARIRTLKAEEESYRELLRRATRLGDVLDIKDRISQVRQQIESYDSQRMMLSRLSALSTLSLRFTTDKDSVKAVPKDGDDDSEWFDDTKVAALGILKGIGKFIAQVATFLFILLPVWIPVVLFLLWFRRRAFVPTTQG